MPRHLPSSSSPQRRTFQNVALRQAEPIQKTTHRQPNTTHLIDPLSDIGPVLRCRRLTFKTIALTVVFRLAPVGLQEGHHEAGPRGRLRRGAGAAFEAGLARHCPAQGMPPHERRDFEVWNAAIDRRPALNCPGVPGAVDVDPGSLVRANDLLIFSPRGGHSVAGFAVWRRWPDGGWALSGMEDPVDPGAGRAGISQSRRQPLGLLDRETQPSAWIHPQLMCPRQGMTRTHLGGGFRPLDAVP